ncbi:hypothetical protein ILYODFUR_003862 [Ilyodon furcidens]|uniref:Uncharacterized protein n=1 Tax=Ilyodon furcidens TaxID=33524 RepID=A0ABV0TG42_9TELE
MAQAPVFISRTDYARVNAKLRRRTKEHRVKAQQSAGGLITTQQGQAPRELFTSVNISVVWRGNKKMC